MLRCQAVLALVVCVALAAFAQETDERETLVETLADGMRVERQVIRDDAGEPVDHGTYRSTWPSGQVREEGTHVYGARFGDWTTYYGDGTVASRGRYRGGRRVGKWETFHPDGDLASVGVYTRGLRNHEWKYYDESGVKTGDSGEYRPEIELYPSGATRWEGEYRLKFRHGSWRFWREDGTLACAGTYRNKRRDGTWTWYWPDGGKRLEGEYERDERTGEWRFWHPDGTLDPGFLSGRYDDGERVGPLELAREETPRVDLDALADPRPYPGLTDPDYELVRRLLGDFVTGEDAAQAEALERLAEWEVAVLPDALGLLKRMDLADEAASLRAYRVVFRVIAQATGGHVFEWRSGIAPEDVAANERAILRWLTLWELHADDAAFWADLRGLDPEKEPGALLALALDEDALDPFAEPEERSEARVAWRPPVREPLLRQYGGTGTEPALEAALRWLAAHQNEDGSWDCDLFVKRCAGEGAERCDGPGQPANDVGVTGLAVLALLGGGSTLRGGPYQDAVARGVAWLQGHQRIQQGAVIGPPEDHAVLYGHAIATMALCKAAQGANDPRLEKQVQAAVECILAARNEGLAWRYSLTPNDENDTSVTAWMVSALALAERNGYRVDRSAFDGALAWIDRVTDTGTGRVGYDGVGSYSSRTTINQGYPREGFEPLTAAGLWCRVLAGQTPEDVPVMHASAKLVLSAPPRFEPDALGNDHYHWYHGTYALFQMGEPYWSEWNEALKKALHASQRREGCQAGSWDPVGPWGYAGGRVYATALLALCLEVYDRYPRFLE